jgi:hypothetical protein
MNIPQDGFDGLFVPFLWSAAGEVARGIAASEQMPGAPA